MAGQLAAVHRAIKIAFGREKVGGSMMWPVRRHPAAGMASAGLRWPFLCAAGRGHDIACGNSRHTSLPTNKHAPGPSLATGWWVCCS